MENNIRVKFPLEAGEKVLYKCNGTYIKSRWKAMHGNAYVTSGRIVFEARPMMMFALFGILGYLLSRKKVVLSLSLSEVTGFNKVKYGLNKNVASIEMIDGTTPRISLGKSYEHFESYYHHARKDVKSIFSLS